MPELPEVETIVRQLRPVLTGKTVDTVTINWHRTVEGEPPDFLKKVTGQKIAEVTRRGKYICFRLGNAHHVSVHLRMTGKLVFQLEGKDPDYVRAIFHFSGGTDLYFVDVRKFGRIKLWPEDKPLLPQLGPEPLDESTVLKVLSHTTSNRAIKTLLLDQTVLAGVGNIYADEALFLVGIHPATRASRVTKKRKVLLSKHLPKILEAAIQNHGTTISDYRTANREKGENQFYLNVYGRAKEPCKQCGSPIRRISLNNRGSHFCPTCQRK
jgi:formamidopyrimidine-DNA glycosylase